jgi:multicomponent Na+:H+ antiporter subunit D
MTLDAALLTAPIVVPLLAAGAALLLSPLPSAQRVLGILALAAVLADAVALLARADGHGPLVLQVGGYAAPLGITVVADRLAALLLVVSSAVLLTVMLYAVGQGAAEEGSGTVPSVFHPSYQVLSAGIALVFLTGDLFTLFVGFEVMLMASYALVTLGASRERVRAGITYVVTSLLASLVVLMTVGTVYGLTGTVNIADLSQRIPDLPGPVRSWLGVLVLTAFAVKAAAVPVHWWLPASYPDAPAPVTAVFAALLTKVAVYAIIRTQTLLFPREQPWLLLLVLAMVTLVVGVAGALGQPDLRRALSFLLVSHIGFMLLGVGLSGAAGTAAAVVYLVHHVIVQAALFLVVGLVERHRGTALVPRLGGVAATAPLVATLFLVPALSLGGIPPLSGFVGKLALLEAAVGAGGAAPLVAAVVAVVTSLATLAVVARIWVTAFWGTPAEPVPDREPGDALLLASPRPARTMVAAAAATVALGVAVAGAAGPLTGLASRIGDDLQRRAPYQDAVLGAPAPSPAEGAS